MAKTSDLDEKRAALQNRLEAYRSLPEVLLDSVGAALQRLFKPEEIKRRSRFLPRNASDQDWEPFPSYWLNGGIIALITFLIGGVIAVLGGKPLSADEMRLTAWAAFAGALALIANKINIRAFLQTFGDSCADKMLRADDVRDLSNWLDKSFYWLPPLLWGVVLGPSLAATLYFFWLLNHPKAGPDSGTFVTLVLACIQIVWVGYYLIPFYLAFPSRLNRYQFDLYTLDPSSSELIGQFSRLLWYVFGITILYSVQLTLGLSFIGVVTTQTLFAGIFFSALPYAPTVILFLLGQLNLSNVIVRSKWKMLNEVQAKIEVLYNKRDVPNKDTLDQLAKLMDYHDRIEATPNWALNVRSSLGFLNSLLLPLLAFVITNWKSVLEFFKK